MIMMIMMMMICDQMTDKSGGREEEKLSNVARVSPVAQASSAPDQAATKLSPPPSYKVAVYEAQVRSPVVAGE